MTTEAFAAQLRWHIMDMLVKSGSGHPGGSLSAADIIACLYNGEMKIDPQNPQLIDRDRLVLCKGHAAPALYATLALKGYFAVEELDSLRQIGSRLQGHPDMKKLPGIDMSTGSLGQGLSIACGMALAAKLDNQTNRVYAILGDGENEEGQVWEAAMFAAHYHLNNITAFLDRNGLQIDGKTTDVLSPEPLDEKWRSFGWAVKLIDGHDHKAIKEALSWAKTQDKPVMIIADTVKGKGVSFMENNPDWHGATPKGEQAEQALKELKEAAGL